MSEYAEIINPEYDPSKNYVYKSFSEYFNYPLLTKIKDVGDYSVYMTRIYAMLGNAYRYLVVFINKDDNSVGFEKSIEDCEWVSLQTRTLEELHNLKPHNYRSNKNPPFDDKINVVSRDERCTKYNCDNLPITITLLHTRKNNEYQYNSNGIIANALETYQTIIGFK
jgi:hypothetical protein